MIEDLDCYLVGGAVRDELLGRAVVDRDWVVVGSTPKQMEALGFIQVGRDFPVYLHPDSHDEYALARTERKRGSGHRGFVVDADPTVTLIEDLCRRDLTINAIAKSPTGELIDPHQGVADLQTKTLRHVSSAFAEDPLRVFRVARFAAQLPEFQLAPDTRTMMRDMSVAGDLQTLSAERVWQELNKALAGAAPARFFAVLADCEGLVDWLPELAGQLDRLTFSAVMEPTAHFAELPLDENQFTALAKRLKAPGNYLQGALDRLHWADVLLTWRSVSAALLNDAFTGLKVLHGVERLSWLIDLLTGRDGVEADLFRELFTLAQGWRGVAVTHKGDEEGPAPTGKAYGEALRASRIRWLEVTRNT